MKRLMLVTALLAASLVVPAQAKPEHPSHPVTSKKCNPHAVGYKAKGTLVSQSLTQTAGAGTATRRDDRYSGTLTIDVTKANHHSATGEQTYTLVDARVRFYDRDHNHVADVPSAGDRVKVHGKITRLPKKCDQTGFTPTITVRKAEFKPPKAVKP
jgi:hypothetical protein